MRIPYPNKLSEAELVAIFYSKLLKRRLNVRLEVTAKEMYNIHTKKRIYGKFDVVIYSKFENIPKLIVEAKKNKKSKKILASEQILRYEEYGLPIKILDGLQAMNNLLRKIDVMIEDGFFDD